MDGVVTNRIPGADALGMGFDALGEYGVASLKSQLFVHQTNNAEQWTYPPTQQTYDVPDNTTVLNTTNTTGTSNVFSSRQEASQYFAAEAQISASYGAFSGQLAVAYSSAALSDTDQYLCVYDADFCGWTLTLTDYATNWVSTDFTNDPDVAALPASFTVENQESFFRVFRKFGTHFVTQVVLGGQLAYYTSIAKSFSSNQQTVAANIDLEYKAVFLDSSAQAQLDWSSLGQTWSSSRTVTVKAIGGDSDPLNATKPTYGSNDASVFQSWTLSVMSNPSVIQFQLAPLSELFSGAQAEALESALSAYLNGALVADSGATWPASTSNTWFDTSYEVVLNGNLVKPESSSVPPAPFKWGSEWPLWPASGFQVVALDAAGDPLLNRAYGLDAVNLPQAADIYDRIMNDVDALTSAPQWVAVVAFGVPLWNYPSHDFESWLGSYGAELTDWKQYIGTTAPPVPGHYVFLAAHGARGVVEVLAGLRQYPKTPVEIEGSLMIYGGLQGEGS